MKLTVRVIPNAKKTQILKEEGILKVKIDAPPSEGRANKRLVEVLADYFSVPKTRVEILRGIRSRNKIVQINR